MEKRAADADIEPNVNERMADRPRSLEPSLEDIPLTVIDTDREAGDGGPIDDV